MREHLHQIDIHVGMNLRRIRLLRGLTQPDLAEAAGISAQAVNRHEMGENRIAASTLVVYARRLDANISELFRDEESERFNDRVDPGAMRAAAIIARLPTPARLVTIRLIDSIGEVCHIAPLPAVAAQ